MSYCTKQKTPTVGYNLREYIAKTCWLVTSFILHRAIKRSRSSMILAAERFFSKLEKKIEKEKISDLSYILL